MMESMKSSLEILFGSTAAKLLLYLFHHGEAYATGAGKDLEITQSAVQRQLEKLETTGLLISKLAGRTRMYAFNPKAPGTSELKALVEVYYKGMSIRERERMFPTRRRPRRQGKPEKGR